MLDPSPEAAIAALDQALSAAGPEAISQLAEVARNWPRLPEVWAELGKASQTENETIAAYAYFRVGYHRGLDTLRAQGWRGSGYVRWQHPTNRGFLYCLKGLQECAAAISEADEAERCAQFLTQLDPTGAPPGE